MTTPSSFNRRVWLMFGGSVLLFGIVWWIAHYEQTVPTAGVAEFAALTSERARLQGSDERVRDRLREQQRGLTRIAWTPSTFSKAARGTPALIRAPTFRVLFESLPAYSPAMSTAISSSARSAFTRILSPARMRMLR